MNLKTVLATIIAIGGLSCALTIAVSAERTANFFGFLQHSTGEKQNQNQTRLVESSERYPQKTAPKDDAAGFSKLAKITPNNSEIPDYITYEVLFNIVRILGNKNIDPKTEEPISGAEWSNYFQEKVELDGAQMENVRQVSEEFAIALTPVHTRAMEVIQQRRAQFPNGVVPQEASIEPSAELAELQQERQRLVLQYRDRLQTLFGDEAFAHFDNAIKHNLASKLVRQPLPSKLKKFADAENRLVKPASEPLPGGERQ